MKTAVSGGAGFIGSHLVERLLEDGHEVIVIDNVSGNPPANLQHLDGNPRLTVHKADITEVQQIQRLLSSVNWVFHLAALADIVPSINDPMKYHRANVDGTVSMLEAARNEGVDRFVYAASSSCYGLPDEFPTPETAPIRPMYPYALTKYLGEQCVLHWNQVYRLPAISLRLFNVYGPRARTSGSYGAVFGVFLAQKLASKPLTIVGDGTQTRDFTFVSDVADCFLRAAESDVEGEVLNVGSGYTYSVNYLAGLLGGESVNIPKRPGEPDCTFGDNRKVRDLLNWQPRVGLEEGVQIMLNNIQQWRDAPVWDPASIHDATRDWFKYLGGGLVSGPNKGHE
jgi:UDP-glucose 4-epimerase